MVTKSILINGDSVFMSVKFDLIYRPKSDFQSEYENQKAIKQLQENFIALSKKQCKELVKFLGRKESDCSFSTVIGEWEHLSYYGSKKDNVYVLREGIITMYTTGK